MKSMGRRYKGRIITQLRATSRMIGYAVLGLALGGCQKPQAPKPPQATSAPNNPHAATEIALVTKVVDGDTIHVSRSTGEIWKIRLRGIDCPESSHNSKCKTMERKGQGSCDAQVLAGKNSKAFAKKIIHGQVTLESDAETFKKDRYGRVLAYVRLADGRDLGAVMIQHGGCQDFGWKYPHPRSPQYKALAP